MKRWSSLRRTAAPIPVALMAVSCCPTVEEGDHEGRPYALLGGVLVLGLAFAHGASAGRDGFDDVVVAGATAEIAFELVPDGRVVELVALAVDHVDGGHDHAGRAVAALQAVMLAERLLHGMQRAVRGRQALDGEDVGAVELPGEHGAGLDRLAVDVDHAGAALRRVAADMRSGEA